MPYNEPVGPVTNELEYMKLARARTLAISLPAPDDFYASCECCGTDWPDCERRRKDWSREAKKSLDEYDRGLGPRKGSWFPTYSGKRFFPEDPRANDICVEDIAHALSRICRFNGHLRRHYSVAQHCVHVAELVPKEHKLLALLHDAAEAYVCDIISPVKNLLGHAYLPIENRVQDAVFGAFGVIPSPEGWREVKRADAIMLLTEVRDLVPSGVFNGESVVSARREKIQECWDSRKAEIVFLTILTLLRA